ncbi:MAG: type III-B CRISPR module RAMP protein Cmr6 [Archaeoglobales archaeon]|nr:type III-B CRISPR module RAMP protein Cmr6 [Archaeoglobales archaeon]
MERNLPLPSDTVKVADGGNRCQNIGLWLDKYLTLNEKWELTQDTKQRKKVFELEQQQKLREILNFLKQRHKALLHWYRQRGFEVRQFEAKPAWRFVVGLGAAHVLETSITLHRIFGLPIIPASGLKGAARAYAQLIEGKSENDQEFIAIFGTTKQTGKIVFLDALPTQPPKFTLDIMNPHFPDYYRTKGKEAPSDWQSPKPVFFLTVSEINYLFAIAARTNDANDLLLTAEKWLKGALRELGIGAKTSANYGYWDV